MQIILQDDSIVMKRFEHVMYNITRIRRHAVTLCHFKEKRYNSQISLDLQVMYMCIHNSCFSLVCIIHREQLHQLCGFLDCYTLPCPKTYML